MHTSYNPIFCVEEYTFVQKYLVQGKNDDGNLGVTQREKWFVLRRSEPLNITQSTVASNLITLQLISVNASLQTRVSLQTIFLC